MSWPVSLIKANWKKDLVNIDPRSEDGIRLSWCPISTAAGVSGPFGRAPWSLLVVWGQGHAAVAVSCHLAWWPGRGRVCVRTWPQRASRASLQGRGLPRVRGTPVLCVCVC